MDNTVGSRVVGGELTGRAQSAVYIQVILIKEMLQYMCQRSYHCVSMGSYCRCSMCTNHHTAVGSLAL